MVQLVLASASPRRKELLEQIGFDFEIVPSGIEENITSNKPGEIVKELSFCKAMDVVKNSGITFTDKVCIGADTIVCLDDQILGKPTDTEDAIRMLTSLQGRKHNVYTGVTLIISETSVSFYEKTEVTMYPMSQEEIRYYVGTGEPMDKAGAYGIQGKCAIYIKEICGDYNNVVGLPVARLYQELKNLGYPIA